MARMNSTVDLEESYAFPVGRACKHRIEIGRKKTNGYGPNNVVRIVFGSCQQCLFTAFKFSERPSGQVWMERRRTPVPRATFSASSITFV